jgi:hypothetical protein
MAQVILLVDDLDKAAGKTTEADETVTVGYNGDWYVLDLTSQNAALIENEMTSYTKYGRRVSHDEARKIRNSKAQRPPGAQAGATSEAREWWAGFRAWADGHGRAYETSTGKFYPKRDDQRDYVSWRLAQGLETPPHRANVKSG